MSRQTPMRTCVGCREKAAKADLLRVVVDASTGCAVVDEAGRRPGRGAHLHRSPRCLALAERRRALPRALRHEGTLDTTAVHAWFEQRWQDRSDSPESAPSQTTRKRSSGS